MSRTHSRPIGVGGSGPSARRRGRRIGTAAARSRRHGAESRRARLHQRRLPPAVCPGLSRSGQSGAHALGYFYDLLDRAPSARHKGDRLRLLVEKLNLRRLLKFLRTQSWDVIVNTHFLPAEMIAALRRQGDLTTPHLTATTDFETHRLWVNQPCDRYFTATEEGAAYLRHWGVPAGDVVVTGIPVHPAFSEPKDRTECRRRLGLTGDRPVVLQLAGGFGVGPVEQLFRGILRRGDAAGTGRGGRPQRGIEDPARTRSSLPRATWPACWASPPRWTNCWRRPTWWCRSRAA